MEKRRHAPRGAGKARRGLIFSGGAILIAAALAGCSTTRVSDGPKPNSAAAYRELLFRNPNHPDAARIRKLLDDADFEAARKLHTAPAYRQYLERHPKGAHANRATYWAERLAYYDALSQMNPEQFQEYLRRYPAGNYASEAQERLQGTEYAQVRKTDTIAAYRKFLARYGKARTEWTAAAAQRLDRLLLDSAKASSNVRALSRFVLDHPKSLYIEEAKQALHEATFERVLNSGDEAAMESFVRKNPGTEQSAVVSRRLEEVVLRRAEQTGRVEALEQFLRRFPNSSQKDRIRAAIALMGRERSREPGQWVKVKHGEVEVYRPRRCRDCRPVLRVNATVASLDRDFTFDVTLQSVLIEKGKPCCRMTQKVSALRPGESRRITFTVPGKMPTGTPPALQIRVVKASAYRTGEVRLPKKPKYGKPAPVDRFAPKAVPPLR